MGTFNHSVKVPKLYKCAAKICQEVARGVGSIKQLVYEKKHFNTSALFALVLTTFQKAEQIELLLKRTKLFEKEPRLDPWLAKIFISELLWGKKKLPQSEAKPIQTILAYEQAFKAHLSDTSAEDTAGGIGCKKPRYVRVNTITSSVNEAVELFQDEGWVLQPIDKPDDYIKFIEQVSYLEGDYFVKDIHLPDLLIFPAGTTFFNHPGYKKGSIILQDKASCLPVHILSPPPGSVVLDMCAAPGMKTTQIAAALKDEGTVFAVERDTKRYEVLTKMIESSGAQCVKTINKDVLDCSNSDFPGVEYILVDPSCSGSGMVDRVVIAADQLESRLQKLSGFQIMILRSALTRYPQAKRVVYSTCSLYAEENEDVVRQVLETNNNFKLVPAGNFVNNMWKNFGASSFGDIGKYCLYARPEDDLTNGFFVAVFERLEDGENNQFYNGRVSRYMKNHHRNEERTKRRELNRTKERQSETDKSKNQDANLETEYFASLEEKSQNKTNDKNKTEEQALEVMTTEITVKKKKKHKQEEETIADIETNPTEINQISEKKKKKKKRKTSEHEEVTEQNVKTEKNNSIEHPTKNKKKKHKEKEEIIANQIDINESSEKKKKTRKALEQEEMSEQDNTEKNHSSEEPAKNKKKKHKEKEEIIANPIDIESSEKKKKKRKILEQEETSEQDNTEKNDSSEEPAKNKKKKHKEKEEIIANPIDINESSEKKKKKRKTSEQEETPEQDNTEKNHSSEEPAKNKKKKHKEKEEIIANPIDIESSEKKKKKRKILEQEETSEQDNTEKNNSSEEPAKNKKKKHKEKEEIIADMETNRMDINESSEKKKTKKKKTSEQEETTEQDINIEKENSNQELVTKKKKKHKQEEETSAVLETNQIEINGNSKNKKKKKREALEQEETIRQDIDIERENSCQEIVKKKKKKKHDT